MQKINLKQAKELLRKQGYDLEVDCNEALLERYNILDDIEEIIYQDIFFDCKEPDELIKIFMNYFKNNKTDVQSKFIKAYDGHDGICEAYWSIIEYLIKEIKCDLAHKFDVEVNFNKNINLSEKNKNSNNFYVLHYDTKTTKYLNDFVFMNFYDASLFFEASEKLNENDRIELIYSETSTGENIVITSK